MSELIRCTRCERLVRQDETACPFCAATSLTKLALPALALVGLTACPGPTVQSVYAGPPPEDRTSIEEPTLEDGGEAAEVEAPSEGEAPAENEAPATPSAQDAGGEDE